jgi:transposase InsO family protein
MPSRPCAGNATLRPPSLPRLACRGPLSAASSGRAASACSPPSSLPSPGHATSAPRRGRSFTLVPAKAGIDIKKLGRFNAIGHRITGNRAGQSNQRSAGAGPGWEFAHVAIDDHSRLAFSQILPNEKQASAVAFLTAAISHYHHLGVQVARVMTDNGSCYKSRAFQDACRRFGVKHIRTRPYTPQTNGKAERFIQTALREWAYATAFNTSEQRRAELPIWLHRYNWHRPHASLAGKPPISRLHVTGNNLMTLHS